METVPLTPTSSPTRIDASTYGQQIGVAISELTGTDTGGSPITSYVLEMDSAGGGTGPWTVVAGGDGAETTSLAYII